MGEPKRGDGQELEAVFLDEEWILIRAVRGAAVLDDPQAPRGEFLLNTLFQDDDAVGDVLLDAVAGQSFSPRSAVMTLVSPRAFSQANRRRSSGAPRLIREAREQRLEPSSTTRLALT